MFHNITSIMDEHLNTIFFSLAPKTAKRDDICRALLWFVKMGKPTSLLIFEGYLVASLTNT